MVSRPLCHSTMADMERVLAAAQGLARLDDSGDLIVSPLPVVRVHLYV